jgi:proline iminopeptidase
MKKTHIILMAGALVLALFGIGGILLWFVLGKPLYQPGMVRAMTSLSPPPQTGAADTWTVEPNIRLHRFAHGAGRNVLMIHGGPGFPVRSPLPGFEPLAERYQFHYYDQRGCGKSTRPIDRFASSNFYENVKTLDQALGLGAQVADIERIRRILGDEQLILVGHSFGAFLATLYAAEFPERVRAMILVGPADLLLFPPSVDFFAEIRALLPENQRAGYADFLNRYMNFGDLFSKSDGDLRALSAEFMKYYGLASEAKKAPVPPETLFGDNGGWMPFGMYLSMGRKHDYRPAVRAVQAPVLVMHGENDLQPESSSRAVASAFPRARVAVIRNTGHFPFYDQPGEFAAVAGKFLDDVTASSGLKPMTTP